MKTLLITIIGLIVILTIGSYIYVSTHLDTNEIRVNLLHRIEKHFPNAKAEMGELSLELGQSIHLKSNLLKFSSKDKVPLLEVKNISVSVPLLSIILGGGNIEVDISNPIIHIDESKQKSNWARALHENTANEFIDIENPKELVIPAFLANSTFALRLHDSELNYKDKGEQEIQKTLISKFVLKNVGINSNAAFELKSDFFLPMESSDILKFHAFIVGSVNLSEYVNTKILPIKSTYKFESIGFKGANDLIPMLSGSFDAEILESGEIFVKNSIRGEKSNLKHTLSLNKNEVELKDFNANIFLSELNPLLAYLKFPLDVKTGELVVSGNIRSNRKGHFPEIEAHIRDLKGKLTESDYSSNIDIKLDEDNADVKGRINLYGGSITWESNLIYTLNDDTDLDRRIKSLNTTIKMADLKLKSDSLRKILLRNTNEEKASNELLLPLFFILPNSSVNADLINSKLDDKAFSMEAKVVTNKGASKIEDLNIEFGSGKLTVVGEAKLYEDGVNTKWKATLRNFSSSILSPFLREDEPFLIGDFNGKIFGPFSIKDEKAIYDFKINLKSERGELVGINLNNEFSAIKDEIKSIPILGNDIKLKDSKISNNYKNVIFDAVAKDGVLNIKKTKYQSSDDSLNIETSGKIFLESDQESLVTGHVHDKVGISSYLSKKLAMKSIPIALRGPGRNIVVDRDYTVSKFSEHLKGKEGKKKVEKVIDENVDKYIKGESGKQIKKLLKGFLK